MIKVMIAGTDLHLLNLFCDILSKDERVEIIKQTHTGVETINQYLFLQPDVLILDLDITMFNGIEVLNFLCNYSIEEQSKCNVLVISNNLKNYTLQKVSKVFEVIELPFDYNILPKLVFNIYEFQQQVKKLNTYNNIIKNTLGKLKFDFSHAGTQYLIDAVLIAKESYLTVFSIDELYKDIAQKYSTSPERIKWNIQNSINSSYKLVGIDAYQEIFENYDGRKPAPKYLISSLLLLID